MKKVNTLERIYPKEIKDEITNESLKLHLDRYKFASEYLKGKLILDLACGVGYGAEILISKNKNYIGVDIDRFAVNYAKKHYQNKNVKFFVSDAFEFNYPKKFDTIVSLETIEHFENPELLVKKFIDLLASEGRIIVSAPLTLSTDINPFHKYDFNNNSFYNLFKKYGFKPVIALAQNQPYSPFAVLREKGRFSEIRPNLISYYLQNPLMIIRRLISTVQFGFTNRYLVVVWQKN